MRVAKTLELNHLRSRKDVDSLTTIVVDFVTRLCVGVFGHQTTLSGPVRPGTALYAASLSRYSRSRCSRSFAFSCSLPLSRRVSRRSILASRAIDTLANLLPLLSVSETWRDGNNGTGGASYNKGLPGDAELILLVRPCVPDVVGRRGIVRSGGCE